MFPPVIGADEQLRPYKEGSSEPDTFKHDEVAFQVPVRSPPHGATLVQEAPPPAPLVWLLPPLPVSPPLAIRPPLCRRSSTSSGHRSPFRNHCFRCKQ